MILSLCKFYLLSMIGLLALNTIINTWPSSHKSKVQKFHSSQTSVHVLKPYHNFVPLSLYVTTKYKWLHMHYEMTRSRFVYKTHLTKNKPAWAD